MRMPLAVLKSVFPFSLFYMSTACLELPPLKRMSALMSTTAKLNKIIATRLSIGNFH